MFTITYKLPISLKTNTGQVIVTPEITSTHGTIEEAIQSFYDTMGAHDKPKKSKKKKDAPAENDEKPVDEKPADEEPAETDEEYKEAGFWGFVFSETNKMNELDGLTATEIVKAGKKLLDSEGQEGIFYKVLYSIYGAKTLQDLDEVKTELAKLGYFSALTASDKDNNTNYMEVVKKYGKQKTETLEKQEA